MRFLRAPILLSLLLSAASAFAGNSVVNLSHYDLMRVDFEAMKREGVIGVIHEATYPKATRQLPRAGTTAALHPMVIAAA